MNAPQRKAPRVIGDRTNMAAAASAVSAKAPEAIEFPAPIINDADDALEDVSARIERLKILFDCNNSDFADVMNRGLPDNLQRTIYRLWTIYLMAAEKLTEIDAIVGAISDKGYADRLAVQS